MLRNKGPEVTCRALPFGELFHKLAAVIDADRWEPHLHLVAEAQLIERGVLRGDEADVLKFSRRMFGEFFPLFFHCATVPAPLGVVPNYHGGVLFLPRPKARDVGIARGVCQRKGGRVHYAKQQAAGLYDKERKKVRRLYNHFF